MENPVQQPPPLKTAVLDNYGTDLTKAASEGKIDVVIGRQKQIDRVVQILCKKERNNACLVGDFSGAGKTILVAEGVAQRISNGIAPQKLLKKKVYSVDLAQLNTGTETRENFKEIFSKIINEVKASNGGIILFIDELHEALEDTNNILKATLAREEFKCVGATTLTKYSCCIEKDSKIESRFSLVNVPEPTLEETVEILKGVRKKFEAFHSVKYSDTALVAAARLSKLHISDGFLKAIDLIDEAGARTHSFPTQTLVIDLVDKAGAGTNLFPTQTHVVTEAEILEQVSNITGIPVEKVATDKEESTRLLKMEDVLSRHIVGQEEAVGAVSRAICRASVGIRTPNRPITSFLFVGPTGVGKTELAKLLATEYFGSKEAMVRLDMSEYKEKHAVSKLFGSPPGYIAHHDGGQLTRAVRRRPHTVVLFDEIEKAHLEVFDAFLQILDDGRLTDSKGKTADFKNTIIIMTSNVGGRLTEESDDGMSVKERVGEELKKVFRPEFLNRIDEVVVFNRLGRSQMEGILKRMIEEVNTRLKEKKLYLVVSENLKEKLLEEGYNPTYGARAMRRAVTRLIEDKVAERILEGKVKDGRVFVDADEAETLEKVSDIIPVEKVATDKEESARLLKIEDVLSRHIIGQEKAVGAVSRAIHRASIGIRNPNCPIASFLFVGPTGVGKTELAKLLSTEYFGSKESIVRLDMSEYKERHSVTKLFGSPPGYIGYHEGGQLTEAVWHRPHNLILFNEIEKAHPEVFDSLLQILDDGRLTDSKWKTVDFKNTIIIMTSNIGGRLTEESDDDGTSSVKERVGEELKKVFKPEFLNRIDEVVVFNRLGRSQMEVILKEMIEEVNTRLKEKNLCLVVSENLKEKLLEQGYNPMYGARAMGRAVTRLIEDKVAERILGGKVNEGRIFMDIEDNLME